MFLCTADILRVTPTKKIAHTAVIKDGWALNEEEIQSSGAQMPSVVQ